MIWIKRNISLTSTSWCVLHHKAVPGVIPLQWTVAGRAGRKHAVDLLLRNLVWKRAPPSSCLSWSLITRCLFFRRTYPRNALDLSAVTTPESRQKATWRNIRGSHLFSSERSVLAERRRHGFSEPQLLERALPLRLHLQFLEWLSRPFHAGHQEQQAQRPPESKLHHGVSESHSGLGRQPPVPVRYRGRRRRRQRRTPGLMLLPPARLHLHPGHEGALLHPEPLPEPGHGRAAVLLPGAGDGHRRELRRIWSVRRGEEDEETCAAQ